MFRISAPLITLFIIIFLLPFSLQSQSVGVVLSGGGAKGIAHVGVLKALEDQGVPIDYIAGTSMGAIVGGMYAAGFSPTEIEEIVLSEYFQQWAYGEIDEKYAYYFKKREPNASWLRLRFEIDSTIQTELPTNIFSPAMIDFGFMEFLATASAASNNNFDSLFIPYRCVAADVSQKAPVYFKEGYMPDAVRASMTYPFYFTPIRVNGAVLFDGGMYDNFPWKVVCRDFNPQFIIGSKVARNSLPIEADDILSQLENMLTVDSDFEIDCNESILLVPDVKQVGELDFSHSKEFIQAGYDAVIKNLDLIRRSVKDSVPEQVREAKRAAFNARKPEFLVNNVNVRGVNRNQAFYLNRLILGKRGKALPLDDVKTEYFKVLADDKVKSIYPRAYYNKRTGYFDLLLDVKTNKEIVANIGGNISSRAINQAFVELEYMHFGLNSMSLKANSYFGRFHSSGQFSSRWDFPTRLPYYLEARFCLNSWDYFETSSYFFEDLTPSYLKERETFFQIGAGVPARNKGKFVLNITTSRNRFEYYQINQFTRYDTADVTNHDFFTSSVYWERNTLNRKQYANFGTFTRFELRYLLGDEVSTPGSTALTSNRFEKVHNWFWARFTYDNYFETIGPIKLGFYGEGLISNLDKFNNYTATVLNAPAFQPFPETRTVFLPSFRAFSYAGAGLKGIWQIRRNVDFRFEAYIFQPYREIRKGSDLKAYLGEPFEKRYFLGNTGLVYHSPIGPVSLFLNFYDHTEDPFGLVLNIGYTIFNKRATE